MQAQEKVSEFIATKPGVQVLKASAVSAMADLAIRCDFPGLKSQPVLSTKPGIQLIKAGTPETIEVAPLVKLSDHKSQIIDLPISEASRPLSLGRFAMQPSIFLPLIVLLAKKRKIQNCDRNSQDNSFFWVLVPQP